MRKHKGFTLIEISLFLAVTAAIFIGIAWGMQNSIFQQRYNDSTQSFLEFMRSIYSKVSNPQSTGSGNSNYALYGKLVVFGERTDLLGNGVPSDEQPVFVYDVIGKADSAFSISADSTAKMLGALDANVVKVTKSGATITAVDLINGEKYEPRWGAAIENTDGDAMEKSILVVKHPRSATINTLVYDGVIKVNEELVTARGNLATTGIENLLKQYLNAGNFLANQVDFCVNPYGLGIKGVVPRQDIRVIPNARNASGVELVDMDNADTANGGNLCLN